MGIIPNSKIMPIEPYIWVKFNIKSEDSQIYNFNNIITKLTKVKIIWKHQHPLSKKEIIFVACKMIEFSTTYKYGKYFHKHGYELVASS